MKFVVQRVSQASVEIGGEVSAVIGRGMVVLMGIHREDTDEELNKWVDKLLKLRIFPDDKKPMNRSVQDIGGEILVVSQFTLYGDTKGQNRPSFIQAAPPEHAKPLYEALIRLLKEKWPGTRTGEFAAEMKLHLVNEGPVTIILESPRS